ncbi:interleukin-4-like [Excalfactoria chinensis]|uniref:interleukin-4-like n=1 Tax=Excalfactoria chinensis TaxID=46218 RepID=UPI003B3BD4BA
MSSSLPTLLALLVLLVGPGAACVLRSSPPLLLKESIRIVKNVQKEVSCDKMNVTDIFVDNKTNNRTELLCEATAIVWENQHCHKNLQGLFLNLCQLLNASSTSLKAPCPVAAGNTTSMKKFLGHLHGFLQQLVKENLLFSL